MNTPLGRNGFIGFAVGATAGLGFITFIIYREISKRRCQRLLLEARTAASLPEARTGPRMPDAHGGLVLLWFFSSLVRDDDDEES